MDFSECLCLESYYFMLIWIVWLTLQNRRYSLDCIILLGANAYASLQPVWPSKCQQPLTNWLKNMNFSLVTGGYQGKMDRSLTLLWILAILFTATFSKYSQLAKEYLFFPNSQWLPGVHQLDCVTGASSSLLWLIPERDIYETVRWETLIEILIGFLHFYFHLFDLNKPLPQISALRG